jgi:L-lactate dehydrogenase
MVAWSAAHISNIPIQQFEGLDPAILCKIAESTKNKAYEIIRAKGATYFGIASVVSSLCESIILDQKHIRPLSVYQDDWKSCLSLPAVIGAKGVERVLPVPLNDNERSLLQQSADRLRSVIEQYQDRLV